MGKKLDTLFRRNFKTAKFKATVNLAISRLTILKNQRKARLSVSQSDLLQLLNLGHHERALLRVDQVIKEQNMLDVFVMIEGYCLLLIERVNLLEQEKVCPEELEEAASSLLYAAARCGEFPELQEIRAVLTSRFGKEFAYRAIELRNNCGVNYQMVQKLSTRISTLESRLKMLKEIASENGIVLQLEEEASSTNNMEKLDTDEKQNQPKPEVTVSKGTKLEDGLPISPKEIEEVVSFSESLRGRKKYRDVADAAQAAFESAAYAAAAARAAVQLSRSESFDPDDLDSPSPRPRKVNSHNHMKSKLQITDAKDSGEMKYVNVRLGFEKIHPNQKYDSGSEDEKDYIENKGEASKYNRSAQEFKRSASSSSSDSDGNTVEENISSDAAQKNLLGKGLLFFDKSDDENRSEEIDSFPPRNYEFSSDLKQGLNGDKQPPEKSNTVKDYDMSGVSGGETYYPSHKQFHFSSQAGLKTEFGPRNPESHFAEGSRMRGAHLNIENRPSSVRTRRVYGL